MALVACSGCGKDVARSASKCPHCGQDHPAWRKPERAMFGCLMVIFGGAFLIFMGFAFALCAPL